MKSESIKAFFLYCTLKKEEYDFIRPLIWSRNVKTLRITSLLSAGMGGIFLAMNLITRSGMWQPYLFLFCGSIVINLLLRLRRGSGTGELTSMLLCYANMLMVCIYAGFLSTRPGNYALPATSIIVFIALLPLTIDDRPIRVYAVMIAETALYLIASRLYKSSDAFSLDLLNAVTFCTVGTLLYAVICTRNVREINQGLRMEKLQQHVISSLATVVEERDEGTGGHISRTVEYVRALTERMMRQERYSSLPDSFYKNVILAAPMHDVGKIRIPDAILNKPDKLTEEEYAIMKTHSVYGAEIITKTQKDVEDGEYYVIADNIAKYHHERYDGTGYPDGLKGSEIPLEARIMALADVYDALVSERVYKRPMQKDDAIKIISEGRGTQFDPELVPLFLECLEATP
jgi:HD-GYP domain-containing protein (c-di-GMP phosphodiesterase class II)